jgi:hypothetical protein
MEYNPKEAFEKRTGKPATLIIKLNPDESLGIYEPEYVFEIEEQNKQILEALIKIMNTLCVDCSDDFCSQHWDSGCKCDYADVVNKTIESITQKKIEETL